MVRIIQTGMLGFDYHDEHSSGADGHTWDDKEETQWSKINKRKKRRERKVPNKTVPTTYPIPKPTQAKPVEGGLDLV